MRASRKQTWPHSSRFPTPDHCLPAPFCCRASLSSNGLPFQDWGAPACGVAPHLSSACFVDTTGTILQNNVYSSAASAIYNGGILEAKKRFSNHFTLLANYTFSKAIDNSTDF